jgi:glyoxylase-like metal-dependent hydrolase (beta-lactamase superfamily II)
MHPICVTCGVQFALTGGAPGVCPICTDERQFVRWEGQRWTTLEELQVSHRVMLREEDANLLGIGMEPSFAIGQRGLLVKSIGGNVLWDCTSLIDEAALRAVKAQGGVDAIAISHPHFYGAMVEWSRAFGGAPIYLHGDDREWVMRADQAIVYWGGDEREIAPGLTLVRCGGHFPGSTVLHWAGGADGRGALLTGDTVMVAMDRRHVSFMRSYPNLLPLSAATVRRIAARLMPLPFDRIFGAWFDRAIRRDAKAALQRSAERYIKALREVPD